MARSTRDRSFLGLRAQGRWDLERLHVNRALLPRGQRFKDAAPQALLAWVAHSAVVHDLHPDSVAMRFAAWMNTHVGTPAVPFPMGLDVHVADVAEGTLLDLRAAKVKDPRGAVSVDWSKVDTDPGAMLTMLLSSVRDAHHPHPSHHAPLHGDVLHPVQVLAPLALGAAFPLRPEDATLVQTHLTQGNDAVAAKLATSLGTGSSARFGLRMGGGRAACRLRLTDFEERVYALHRRQPEALWRLLRDVAKVVGPVASKGPHDRLLPPGAAAVRVAPLLLQSLDATSGREGGDAGASARPPLPLDLGIDVDGDADGDDDGDAGEYGDD